LTKRPRLTGRMPQANDRRAHHDDDGLRLLPIEEASAFRDSGAVTTNDDVIAPRMRTLGNYGNREKYRNELLGRNSRLDPLQDNGRRRRVAQATRSRSAASTGCDCVAGPRGPHTYFGCSPYSDLPAHAGLDRLAAVHADLLSLR
jgi:DegT/DnrJ/EryC1/StrS aminotransferase family